VADVHDLVALAGPDLHLVMHLGHQRAHRVHDVPAAAAGGLDHLGRGAVGAEHHRPARRHVGDVVDEHHPEVLEPLHDQPVVDDLVVAVDGRLEGADHPRERLDRHLHAGAEPPRRGEQHPVDGHAARLPMGPRPAHRQRTTASARSAERGSRCDPKSRTGSKPGATQPLMFALSP
jgi:hypothetical protein